MITTKRGKAGKIKIDAKVETTYNTRTVTPKFEDGFTYASLMNESRITRNNEAVYKPEELDILRLGLDTDFIRMWIGWTCYSKTVRGVTVLT